jgi:hypothetical protein
MLKSIFAAALILSTATFNPVFAEDAKLIRTISLAGHGEIHATPDLAIVNMGVISSAVTAREALDSNTKAMNDLMAVLKSANIETKDISTSNFSVNPRYDYGQNNGQPPKVVGYDVSNTVSVMVRKRSPPAPIKSMAFHFQSPIPELLKTRPAKQQWRMQSERLSSMQSQHPLHWATSFHSMRV